MKRCIKCGTMLKNNATKCSVCGEILKGQDNFSDVTTTLVPTKANEDLGIAFKSRKTLILWTITLGFLGACWFYLGKKIHGVISILVSLLLIAGCLVFGLSINRHLSFIYYFVLALIPIFSVNTGHCLYFIILRKVADSNNLPLK